MTTNIARSLRLAGAAILVAASALVVGAGPASAANVDVCNFGCPYTTVQDAVDNAAAGDTIRVGTGQYTEAVTVNKDLTIDGQQAELGSILVDPLGTAFTVNSGAAVTIRDLEIKGTAVGIDVVSGTVTLLGNTFANNATHAQGMTTADIESALSATGVNANTFDVAVAHKPATGTGSIATTVAAALAGAVTGDTVEALDGTFTENVTLSSGVTLTSQSGAATTTISGTVNLSGTADGASVDGLTITGAVSVANGADGTTLSNNTVNSAVTVGTGALNTMLSTNTFSDAVAVGAGANDSTLSGNTFSGAVTVAGPTTNVDVINNVFESTGAVALAHAADASDVEDNTFTAQSTDAALDLSGVSPVVVNNTLDGAAVGTAPVGAAPDEAVAIRVNASASGARLTDNLIQNNTWGVVIGDNAASVELDHNDVRSNVVGIHINVAAGDSNEGHYNNIAGNTSFGVKNRSGFLADFSRNWWNDASGPEKAGDTVGQFALGDQVFGVVDTFTWCVTEGCMDEPVQEALLL